MKISSKFDILHFAVDKWYWMNSISEIAPIWFHLYTLNTNHLSKYWKFPLQALSYNRISLFNTEMIDISKWSQRMSASLPSDVNIWLCLVSALLSVVSKFYIEGGGTVALWHLFKIYDKLLTKLVCNLTIRILKSY